MCMHTVYVLLCLYAIFMGLLHQLTAHNSALSEKASIDVLLWCSRSSKILTNIYLVDNLNLSGFGCQMQSIPVGLRRERPRLLTKTVDEISDLMQTPKMYLSNKSVSVK